MLDLVRKARRCIHAQRTAYVDEITGKTLLAWGYKPGGWFGAAIAAADQARRAGADEAEIRAAVDRHLPAPAATLRRSATCCARRAIALSKLPVIRHRSPRWM
jgi:hypothetical protein